jgi:DNA-binding beta-propeller fold protein YncE
LDGQVKKSKESLWKSAIANHEHSERKSGMKGAHFLLPSVLFLATALTAVAQESSHESNKPPVGSSQILTHVKDYPLPGSAKRLDYQSVDESRSMLFIAHLGDNSVTVFDLKTSKVVKHLTNIPQPHGILAVPPLHKVYVSATGNNQVYVLDEDSLTIVSRIPAGDYPDGLDYDPNTHRIFVSDEHGGTVTVLSTLNDSVVATIAMGGEVGNTHFDPVSKTIYSAVQTTDELVEINPASMTISARYKLPGCEGAHGFFIEPETRHVFITGEGNDGYVVFDLASKAIIASGKVGPGPDVLAFDRGYHVLYVSAESGIVSVFTLTKGATKKLWEGPLAPHAHTVSVDQVSHRVYFPLQDINGKPVLRVMQPDVSKLPKE